MNLENINTMSAEELESWFRKSLQSTRTDGISFKELLEVILSDKTKQLDNLKLSFDKLFNANISLKGSPLDTSIDISSGRFEAESLKFFYFIHETVFLRLKL